jgi:hypothetical protein
MRLPKKIGLWFGAGLLVILFLLTSIAFPVAAQSLFSDPVPGTCSELNNYVRNTGVADIWGERHADYWGWTSYLLLINGLSLEDHRQRNYVDLLNTLANYEKLTEG